MVLVLQSGSGESGLWLRGLGFRVLGCFFRVLGFRVCLSV